MAFWVALSFSGRGVRRGAYWEMGRGNGLWNSERLPRHTNVLGSQSYPVVYCARTTRRSKGRVKAKRGSCMVAKVRRQSVKLFQGMKKSLIVYAYCWDGLGFSS